MSLFLAFVSADGLASLFLAVVSADKVLEGWLMVKKKLLLEKMDIFMFKRKKVCCRAQ